MDVVFVVRCVGSGLCDKLITSSEESYRVCVCVCLNVCDLDTWQSHGLCSSCAVASQKSNVLRSITFEVLDFGFSPQQGFKTLWQMWRVITRLTTYIMHKEQLQKGGSFIYCDHRSLLHFHQSWWSKGGEKQVKFTRFSWGCIKRTLWYWVTMVAPVPRRWHVTDGRSSMIGYPYIYIYYYLMVRRFK